MAKCERCAAPLTGAEIICEYCGSRNDIDLHIIHSYTNERPIIPRVCPSCSISLKSINIGDNFNFFIEYCTQCKGIFFDNGELEALYERVLAKSSDINISRLHEYINIEVENAENTLFYKTCPVCFKRMTIKSFLNIVAIQSCMAHGDWIESTQLNKLLEVEKITKTKGLL